MNKKKGKILGLALALMLLFMPTHIMAKTTNSGTDNAKCKSRVGISISVDPYKRSAGYRLGSYWNSVQPRTITIKGGADYNYTLYQYTADIGDLEEMDDLSFKNVRGNDIKPITRDFKGSTTVEVPAGKEVFVVAILKSDKDDKTNKSSKSCSTGRNVITKNKNGNDQVNCCTGEFKKKASDTDNVDISGVAASKFVQNPAGDSLNVKNILNNKTGVYPKVCQNAFDGKATGDYKKYSITDPTRLADWQQNYYPTLLSYCNSEYVPFNLDEEELENLANKILELYYNFAELKSKGTADYNAITNTIETIKNHIKDEYGTNNYYIVDHKTKKTEGNSKVLGSSLSCNYTDIIYDNDLKEGVYKAGSGESEYLYAETTSETANIKTKDHPKKGEEVEVCSTKCYEHLTVVYSPPKTVKAGLCFQYRVTVKSVTDCGVTIGNFMDKLVNYKQMCSPNPVCENDETKTQAGPSEEFDQCVKSCDGGKYSQNCINKCYDKVYGKTETTSKNSKTTKTKLANTIVNKAPAKTNDLTMGQTDSGVFVTTVASYKKSDLEDYDKEPIAKCTTKYMQAHGVSDECAQYYFRAKTLYPKGHYECNSSQVCSWHPDNKKVGKINTPTIESIGKQIARSSPFYVRSWTETKNLIQNLFNANGRSDRKYYISDTGIKTQASKSGSYHCKMNCGYHGCSSSDALTSEEYTDAMKDNISNVNDALAKCQASSYCDTKDKEKTTSFEISVSVEKDKEGTQTTEIEGSNTLHNGGNSTNNNACPDGQNKPSMFVPAFKNDSSENGILGFCYDDTTKTPHYQTTITFPGSWIDLKTGEVKYDCQALSTNRVKEQYYCTPYDAQSTNEKWWDWYIDKFDSGKYPNDFEPDKVKETNKWNITASLGTESQGFGKYRWHIGFQCFYALKNKVKTSDYVYRGDEGTAENTEVNEEIDRNYDIRVVSLESMFPNNRLRGYNWGSQATLSSKDKKIQTALNTTGYGVDPVTYSHQIIGNQNGKGENGTYTEDYDLRVTLDSDDVTKLKNESLDLTGKFNNKVKDIPGLYYYKMKDEFVNSYHIDRKWTPGENSKTAQLVTGK